ncbi:PAS domain-containing hybrid sensor histidine kinase/response regulator [Erythrobacteraceae bacterium CFH 75059]|uniref:PAS domain-containing hybrid sensor histidine kinase/response regulator n=1 Tax=Qipengyuania thermophila TaxID=2509361 RepID=UPI00102045F3|nr:PAS domain-containing hybrid sensor histidine kinase/response regulator [Qipengyuania thermophila]TCD01895.1 PAS domain-containing hybrid sensor histidine kinase/response regulator [Erythrobacteraceae bacterium CFH 75059]
MSDPAALPAARDHAAIVYAPRGRDAQVAADVLHRHGIETLVARSMEEVRQQMLAGVGAAVLAEEGLHYDGFRLLEQQLAEQAPWSDLPIVVLTNGGRMSRTLAETERLRSLGNVVLLPRPLHADELVHAVKSALRARERQYETRGHLEELERRQKRLRASDRRFQAIANFIDQMVWSTLPDGYHDYYNDRWYEFTGVPVGSTDGDAWNGIFHPDDQERAWARWRHSLATGEPYEIEYRLRHRSGEYRWVLGKAKAERNSAGAITRWYGTCTDIHDQVLAREMLARSRTALEEAVRQRTEQLETALAEREAAWAMAVDLLVVVDPDTRFSAINPAWTTLLGWSPEDLIGRPFPEITHPDDLEETLVKFRSVFDEPLVDPYEFRLRHKDGSYRYFAWTAQFNNGAVFATGRDMTQQRLQAEALAATEAALRQSQKLETIGQLTGGVAHDFNNLLMAIRSSLDLLEKRLPGDDAKLGALLRNAVKATERGASLTQRMLAFARKQELDVRPTSIVDLLEGMRDLLERSLGPQIAVTIHAPRDVADAMVDPNQLEMAVLNLAVNARDAMNGPGRLDFHLEEVDVESAPDLAPGRYLSLRVQDTGSGMDAATLAQALEPFFTTKGVGKGTGLGLSMVHGLVHQLGGALRLESTVGEGTTATILLPAIRAAAAPGQPASPISREDAVRRRLRILTVDDDALVLFGTAALLEDLGHEVVEAGCGEEALELARTSDPFDLVITDQAMPNMTGLQLAEVLHEEQPDLPVILASGYAEIEEGALRLIAARLEKPFTDEALRRAIAKALDSVCEPAQ